MEIHKRPSHGRGEYEIAGSIGNIGLKDLYGREILIDAGDLGVIPSGIHLVSQGGKPRLRKRAGAKGAIHLHRQIEALLLLPKSIREEAQLVGGQPIVLSNRYVMRRIDVASVKMASGKAVMRFGKIDCINDSGTHEVDFRKRIQEIKALYNSKADLPQNISAIIEKHHDDLSAGVSIGRRHEQLVSQLISAAEEAAPDYGKSVIPGADPIPFLTEIVLSPDIPEPPPIDEVDPTDLEIRRRVADRWRQYKDRGPAAAKFRREVREAYRSTCIVCGLRLPPLDRCRVPGVDAAHILPWAQYDADVVPNGLCLCKHHHWAFDQLLIAIVPEAAAGYRVAVTKLARDVFAGNEAALADLQRHEGPIDASRLPLNGNLWPRAAFLEKLADELGLEL